MNKKQITSPQNNVIKNIKELQKKKSARKSEGLFVIEGIRGVKEIPSHVKIKYLITTSEVDEKELGAVKAEERLEVSKEIYNSISDTQSPQGAMAVAYMPTYDLVHFNIEAGHYLVLENLQDPGNLGTIIRTAHAFDFKGVFITKGSVDLYSPKVVRSTMSSLFHVPIVIEEEIDTYMDFLKQKGVTLYTTALIPGAKPIYDVTFEEKVAIIIGNEGNGVSERVKEASDHTVIIPMPGAAESLNAAIATSICMYEITRQCQKGD
ncbi:TrmH family RNA methyltransferase [Cellulosilyticum lentocellum]|uniref:tRNA/rRNA methyltransferase (SpoU) n=1 Tax=Cellulosilyticum lentocellum (strain ATCC 49066 / DSM 5427 / NCIMB 11756 / RHM5) TaxID=642492 RepID=F2JIB7_CELLD|nr:RNA methyltransferase [Cellulosilyticum lentocellum]ADZ84283.1 tRNA/rRNA methyltransferase (SpoU) [Cellulosilyticum lentocellum DSM 5427]